jgi:hypothetical protein
MSALDCPTCGERGLSVARKLSLGPARSILCASCGARIGVPWIPSLLVLALGSVIPLFTSLYALVFVGTFTSTLLFMLAFLTGALVGVVPLLWAYVRFVPLVRRGA